jgi:glycosidase
MKSPTVQSTPRLMVFFYLLLLSLLVHGTLVAQIGPADSIYFLITDRFNDGDPTNNFTVRPNDVVAYHGGDFAGIIEKLDYIAALGNTAIWISPVVDNQSGGYHGYWAIDFYGVEEHFGDMEILQRLVRESQSRGIKVIIDLVVNHTGLQHPWVSDPDYVDWFNPRITLRDFNDPVAVENHWLAGLPDLNQHNPETRQYLIDMAIWWIDQLGHDGYRLDTVRHVPRDFWEDFTQAIHGRYPDFFLIGESFDGDPARVASYQRAGFNGMLDFPMYFSFREMIRNGGPARDLARAMMQARVFPDRSMVGTFIDNHDVPRFMNQIRTFRDEKLSQGLLFLYTYTGIPILYYGTEFPIDAPGEHTSRMLVPWEREARFAGLISLLARLRAQHPALSVGEIDIVYANDHVVVFSRQDGDQVFLTILNNSEVSQTLEFDLPPALVEQGFRSLVEVLGSKWLGPGTGAVVANFVDPVFGEAGMEGLVASERARFVVPARDFDGTGLPDLEGLIAQGRRLPVGSQGRVRIQLDPYTGSLLKLSFEPGGIPQWIYLAVSSTVLLLMLGIALVSKRRRARRV